MAQKSFGGVQTMASLLNDAVADAAPSRGQAAAGYRGAPTLATNPIDSGERAIVSGPSGPAYPAPYGGAPAHVKNPTPRTKSGHSGSGQKGAVDNTQPLL